jgi:hypothetical protein
LSAPEVHIFVASGFDSKSNKYIAHKLLPFPPPPPELLPPPPPPPPPNPPPDDDPPPPPAVFQLSIQICASLLASFGVLLLRTLKLPREEEEKEEKEAEEKEEDV